MQTMGGEVGQTWIGDCDGGDGLSGIHDLVFVVRDGSWLLFYYLEFGWLARTRWMGEKVNSK